MRYGRRMRRWLALVALAACAPPVTPARPVTDTYFGVAVADPYRWLEGETEDVHTWTAGQNARAREVLDRRPRIDTLRAELRAILAAPATTYDHLAPAGGKLFALRKQSTHEQPELVVMADPAQAAAAKLVLDPAAAGGAQQTIDWFRPSPDGTRVAVSLSARGSEAGVLHIIDLAGNDREPPLPRVQFGTGGGDVAWTPDSAGLYYTRYPAAGEKPERERDAWVNVWFHELGTPAAADHYELGRDLPRIAEILLASDARGRVLASVQNGDGGTFRHYLRDAAGWRQLDDWGDAIVSVEFGDTTDDLWLVSRAQAPRGKILKLAASARSAAAAVLVVPERADTVVTEFSTRANVLAVSDRIVVAYQVGGPSELRAFTLAGAPATSPAISPVSAVGAPVRWQSGAVFTTESFIQPRAFRQLEPATGAVTDLAALSPAAPVDLSAFELSREWATSKDGTQIPMSIAWPKGAPRDGSRPCLVMGYGGFGISSEPGFLGRWAPLLARGVCFVEVNLRGGAEYGEAWHQAGARTHKQNVFDDFTAALELLVAKQYTQSAHLAIIGRSNGGLLMGAMLTQHPTLVHAVVAEVGIYDSLRYELSPNGAYNIPELGTVRDPAQFAALHAYSPYHHVARAAYPAVLMSTGDNDARVSPWHSRKMIAALQAAQTGRAPILLVTTAKGGHGAGASTTEAIDLLAHEQAFLLDQLAVP